MPEQRPEGTLAEKQPAAELLPEVYAELRRLAAAMSDRLPPGQTLQPTALVHEAYLRLVRTRDPGWEGRRHFFAAAAQAMREILIERARRQATLKHGGEFERIEIAEGDLAVIEPPAEDLLALDEAIEKLQATKPHLAEIVMLRFYAGLSIEDTADAVGRSASTVKREWRFARAWLARSWARVSVLKVGAASRAAQHRAAPSIDCYQYRSRRNHFPTRGFVSPARLAGPTIARSRAMTDAAHDPVEALFLQVVELPPAERAAFLDSVCGGDSALRIEVESLLAYDHHGATCEILPHIAVELAAEQLQAANGAGPRGQPELPTMIGRYRILRCAG